MRTSEWVTVAYLAYLLASGAVRRASARQMWRVAVLAVPTSALIALLAHIDASPVASSLRDWLPGAYVLVGYRATGLLYSGPDAALEARLAAIDARLFARFGVLVLRLPRAVLEARLARRPISVRRVNLRALEHGSIQVNTFPSGHVASAWAVALFLTTAPGAAWVAFTALAAAIGTAAFVGRYHYALDVVAGLLVAVLAFVLLVR